uniref:Uncharacterized protein n=3 Tax=Aegilops tauschii subsp. strangulata TaxID=200361 RepID=A0A453DMI9_AEGTS
FLVWKEAITPHSLFLVERERERPTKKKKKGMATAPPRLLRGLIAPLSLSPADWLPCHQQLLTSASLLHRWLARLRCSDGFKLFLVVLLVSAALAEVSYMHVRAAVCGGYCLLQGAYRAAELWHK